MQTTLQTQMTRATSRLFENRWKALALLCLAQFVVIMDTSIIGIALPAIKSDLNYTQTGLQWIFNAYVVVFGGLLLLGGKLSDVYGPKRLFLGGFGILAAASLFAGLAWDDASLNIARGLQGLGAAFIAPASLTLLMTIFRDPKEVAKAMGMWGAAAAAGGTAGVFLGGVITEWLDWRWVFFINIPLALIVLLAGPSLLPSARVTRGGIDYLSALLGTGALVSLVYGIVGIGEAEHTSLPIISLVASVLMFILFFWLQKTRKEPLLPLGLFRVPNLAAGNGVMLLMAAAWIPLWFFLNLYVQQVLGFTAFESGLALVPMTLAIMVLMVGVTGKLIGWLGIKKVLVLGLALLTLALVMFANVPADGTFLGDVLLASLVAAAGMAFAYVPGTMASMANAKPEEAGLASGIVNTGYQIGSAVGLALMTALSAVITQQGLAMGDAPALALTSGFQAAFIGSAAISLLALVIALAGIRFRNA